MLRAPIVLVAILGLAASAASERIRSFDVVMEVEPHGSITVTETMVYDFGSDARHGIFRRIPVRYARGRAADYRLDVDVVWVGDDGGRALPHRTAHEGRDLVVRIGDPDSTVTGTQHYRLRYRVDRALLHFDAHDELYWNVTGTGWPVTIDTAQATVHLPAGVGTEPVRLACFTGPAGSVEQACRASATADGAFFTATGPLAAGTGLTLVLGFPKGLVAEPSALRRLLRRASDWWSPLDLLPLAVLGLMGRLWWRWGRDPRVGVALPVRYEPPAGMTPAEMGTVLDERVHITDLTSTILDLAVRGHLRIIEHESRRFLFLDERDYELVRLGGPKDLRPFEEAFLAALFADGDAVRVSTLKNRFYQHLPALRRALYRDVTDGGRWFAEPPERVRRRWMVVAGALAVLAFVVLQRTTAVHALPVFATALVILGFAPLMPRRTAAGRRACDAILGFREFLERVDADRLERTGGRTTGRFERVLPYAVVLGLADGWADAFADVYARAPSWYRSSTSDFRPRTFVSDLGRSLDTMGRTMSSRPGGSGRSGLSGGGSSGGGFGGGGGGSW